MMGLMIFLTGDHQVVAAGGVSVAGCIQRQNHRENAWKTGVRNATNLTRAEHEGIKEYARNARESVEITRFEDAVK
jgi:hypothetical protein